MKISDAKEFLRSIIRYNIEMLERGASPKAFIVPMLEGPPGVGKTAAPTQVAAELEIPYFQTIVAQYDAGELAGFPMKGTVQYPEYEAQEVKDETGNKTTEMVATGKMASYERMMRLRPGFLPDIDDPMQRVGLYNLDELPQAFLANQNICSQLVNEYRIGEHRISPGITMCGTGNAAEHKAGTTAMPMHLRDRLTFITIEANADEFLQYAAEIGANPRVRAYIAQRPDHLMVFKTGVNAFPSPRSWIRTASIIDLGNPKHIRAEAIRGQLGDGEATEFEAWLRVEDKLPKWQDILADPMGAPVFGNKDADVLYLLLATLADQANDRTVEAMLKYITRLPNREFQAYWAKQCFSTTKGKALLNNKHVSKWSRTEAKDLLF